jgi:sec-independent protein translocase protein TatA
MTPVSPVLGEIVGWEFLLVLAVVALLFGSSQLPKLARSMGQASKEFRKGMDEGAEDQSGVADDADTRDA